MIKLFRNIRQNLLNEGKTSRYLKYAIGEIILVVIGILIALQINTWNENRIRANEELNILKALKIGLETDQEDLLYNAKKLKSSIASADRVIYSLENDLPYNDSIANQIGDLMFPVLFVHSTSAFETLKSKGIDLIKNNRLRDEIIGVYDSGYNFFMKYETSVYEESERGAKYIFPSRFKESNYYDFNVANYNPQLIPLDYEALKMDQEFIYYIKSYRNRLSVLLNFHYELKLLKSIKSLLNSITIEIEDSEK